METKNKLLPLGTKVNCQGYIKKTGNCLITKNDYESAFNTKVQCESESGYYDINGKSIDYEEFVYTKQFVENPFVGFICGKKTINTAVFPIYFWNDHLGDVTQVWKDAYVYCYEVCVENKNHSWGKRYVPMNKVEVEDNE